MEFKLHKICSSSATAAKRRIQVKSNYKLFINPNTQKTEEGPYHIPLLNFEHFYIIADF